MLISDLVSVLNAVSHGSTKGEVTGVSYDSRKVAPGNLFVCIPGTKIDGHEFIPQALEQGARGLVTQRLIAGVPESVAQIIVPDTRIALARISSMWFHDPCKALRMIGVTGTNGKTTTTHLVKGLLEKKGEKVGLVGTIHNLIGDVELAATHTTPESWELMGLLDQMVQRKAHTVVMEVSSHALKQNRVAGCEFDGAVFTNLTQDHLDFHLNWEDYLNSKLKLFSNLHAGLKGGAKYAVINADDPAAPEFIRVSQVPVWTYGIREKAHIQATDIAISSQGTNFTLNNAQGVCPLSVPLTGTFNVYNVLAAVTVALLEGVSMSAISEYLSQAPQVPGRFELIDEGQPFSVIVDYAHTPDGLENILSTAKDITPGRLITVFGCGGDRDRGKRPIMGRMSGKYSGFSIITSDNPRTEDPGKIIEEIEKGISQITSNYKIIEDRHKAIGEAIKMAVPGDTVVIAGKGHETYQLVKGKTLHFDDREIARKELKKLDIFEY